MLDKKQIILVTGANGQLGSEFKTLQNRYDSFQFIFVDKLALDITNQQEVSVFFQNNKIDFCINAAAYTAVDAAEKDVDNAFLLNAEAVDFLAETCLLHQAKLIQISTDFVFDGKSKTAYKETDETNPLSVYGSSKLKGEKIALKNDGFVIRTSWLYSIYGNNFVKTMLKLGIDRDSLNIISDQVGTPTYAKDLAEVIMFIINNYEKELLKGLYHFSNSGKASWYDLATEIFNLSTISCKTNPIPTTEYPTPAERPKFSLMDKSKIGKDFDVKLKDWKQSLAECLKLLNTK